MTAAERLLADPGGLSPGWSCAPTPGASLDEMLEVAGARSFETSGSWTGVPSTWWRSPAQLAREAAMTIAALPRHTSCHYHRDTHIGIRLRAGS